VRLGILGDYDAALDKVYGGTAAPSIDPTKPSHLQLDLDEDGEAVLARFTYVDENTCIGCKNCALVARNTFLMEEELGKARVYAQASSLPLPSSGTGSAWHAGGLPRCTCSARCVLAYICVRVFSEIAGCHSPSVTCTASLASAPPVTAGR
jgi:NAD-dependent dihydropyrimidine dehydrogenase PreA subunit